MWPKHAHHKIMYVFLTVWLQKIEPGKCFNYYTSIAQFYITYHFAANSRSTSETQRDYSNRRIWETSIMSSLCTSVSIHTFFSCSNSENFTLFFRIFTLYSKSLPLDLACRVWDVFCRDGEEFLFRTALGILKLFEDILTKMDFIHIAQFLTKLPEDLPSEEFFTSIAAIQMQSRNKKWAQVKRILIFD